MQKIALYIVLNPLPNLPPRGKEFIISPLGEIEKGVKNN
jgi:hypothetical protein